MLTKFLSYIKRYFIAGLLTIIPVAVTVYLIFLLIKGVYKLSTLPLKTVIKEGVLIAPLLSLFSIFAAIIMVCAVGMFATNIIGRRLIESWETLLKKVPLIRSVYTGVKELLQVIFLERSSSFKKVVLVQYPRKGLWCIGFVTSEAFYMKEHTKKKTLTLFIPTTPNPTSGFFIIVPEEDVTPLDISVEEGLKLVVSGGLIRPTEYGKKHL